MKSSACGPRPRASGKPEGLTGIAPGPICGLRLIRGGTYAGGRRAGATTGGGWVPHRSDATHALTARTTSTTSAHPPRAFPPCCAARFGGFPGGGALRYSKTAGAEPRTLSDRSRLNSGAVAAASASAFAAVVIFGAATDARSLLPHREQNTTRVDMCFPHCGHGSRSGSVGDRSSGNFMGYKLNPRCGPPHDPFA